MQKGSKKEGTQQDTTKVRDYIAKLRRSSRNRESYDEIAELEAELRRAYITKELQAQILERETERYIENVRKQQAAELMRLEQQAVLEDDLRQRSESLEKSEDYRKELTIQMKRKEEEKSLLMEEARHEREVLTEMDRIREQHEELKTFERKNQLAETLRRERLIFQEIKQIREEEERAAEAEKLYKDEKYLKEIDERVKRVRNLYEEQLKRRERTMSKIANILINAETRKKERDILIDELIAEDVKYESLLKEEVENIQRKRMREELAANLKEQIVFTEQCKLRFVEQDRMFAEEIMRKIIEDEKTARLTAAARRRMQLQYREDLARLIETRRKIREEEIFNTQETAKEEKKREEANLERIKEDRKRLLEKHASNVGDFINKSALSEEEQKIIEQFT